MAKTKTLYRCSNCNTQTTKWQGQCSSCNMWNTLVEDTQSSSDVGERLELSAKKEFQGTPSHVADVMDVLASDSGKAEKRYVLDIEEVNRVFGGGITSSSVTLLSGEPGIGKSTISLQLAGELAKKYKVMYISGEESLVQVSSRAKRLGFTKTTLKVVHETIIEHILATCIQEEPDIVFIDSISVMMAGSIGSMAGSISQIRFVTELLVEYAKSRGITIVIIGHVTKDGSIAGPKALEHLVDTVMVLEGEKNQDLRFMRAMKNRFGALDEVGVFTMSAEGLREVANPSALFLEGRREGAFGSVLTSLREGSRNFLVEIQGLTAYTKFGYPKRTSIGVAMPRLQLILAVLGSYSPMNPDNYDVYVNIVGGLTSRDTAIDLALLMAIYSAKHKKAFLEKAVVLGEVGLTGEVRSVSYLQDRLKEAERLGMEYCVVPKSQAASINTSMKVMPVNTVEEAFKLL